MRHSSGLRGTAFSPSAPSFPAPTLSFHTTKPPKLPAASTTPSSITRAATGALTTSSTAFTASSAAVDTPTAPAQNSSYSSIPASASTPHTPSPTTPTPRTTGRPSIAT